MTVGIAVLATATLLVSLLAGFLFAFAVVVMPGISELEDGEFIRVFQRIDGVIQAGDPLFGLVFVGSILALIGAAVLAALDFDVLESGLLFVAVVVYFAGVIAPTGLVNVPLNNQLQRVDVNALDALHRAAAREAFEPLWNRWNRIRTALACISAALLTGLLIVP